MSSETQLVFRPEILSVIFFSGTRFCLVDVFRFHVPHSSIGKLLFHAYRTNDFMHFGQLLCEDGQ